MATRPMHILSCRCWNVGILLVSFCLVLLLMDTNIELTFSVQQMLFLIFNLSLTERQIEENFCDSQVSQLWNGDERNCALVGAELAVSGVRLISIWQKKLSLLKEIDCARTFNNERQLHLWIAIWKRMPSIGVHFIQKSFLGSRQTRHFGAKYKITMSNSSTIAFATILANELGHLQHF